MLIAAQRTAAEAVAAASAALAVVYRALKDAVEVAAAAPDLADVVGGRRTRKQAQAVRAQKDDAKAQRKARRSDAQKRRSPSFASRDERAPEQAEDCCRPLRGLLCPAQAQPELTCRFLVLDMR